ncbi:type II secretion system F family protein [Candidatus Uhrbacteria bacterium]|nr:type II secretion system F family protein [Candidatus Uhrbacteria bacterium]
MPQYRYKGLNRKREEIEGIVEAEADSAAGDILLERGFTITEVKEIRKDLDLLSLLNMLLGRVSKKDLAIMLRQLSILVSAAIPLVQALRMLSEQTAKEKLRRALTEIASEVDGGSKLSSAFARFPKIFSEYFINMVRSGETTGRLDEVLTYLAEQQEKDYDLQGKVIGAISYPIFIICVMVLVGFAMMTFVLPKMLEMFKQFGPDIKLPWTTRLLITTSDFMNTYWWLVILGFIGAVIGIMFLVRTHQGKLFLDRFKLSIPIFGLLFKNIAIVRFSRGFGTILVGGVTIPMGLRIVRNIMGNSVFEDLIDETIHEVEDGNSISSAFGRSKVIPKMVTHMIAVGEQTGRLDDVLKKITEFYVREVNMTIETTLSMVEPAIMVLLGVAVGVLVSGILLPMYSLSSQM